MASQVTFLASAVFIMDPLYIFVITTQAFFQCVVNFFSYMNYFLLRLVTFLYGCMNEFFMRTTNYFLVVLQIIFNTSIENYFFIVLIIIFCGIINLFLGLQYTAGLRWWGDWLKCLPALWYIILGLGFRSLHGSELTYFWNCVKQDGNNSHFPIRREKLARKREPAWDQSFQPAGVRLTPKAWELAGILLGESTFAFINRPSS